MGSRDPLTIRKMVAQELIDMAEKAFQNDEVEKAAEFARQAENMLSTFRGMRLLSELERHLTANQLYSSGDSTNNNITSKTTLNSVVTQFETAKITKKSKTEVRYNNAKDSEKPTIVAKKIYARSQSEKINNGSGSSKTQLNRYSMDNSDCNIDELHRCLKCGEKAYDDSDWDKAERFFLKAQKMSNSDRIQYMLEQIQVKKIFNRISVNAAGSQVTQALDPKSVEYKEAVIARIDGNTNDYRILGIPDQATLHDVVEAHKHLIKLLHPDKNRGRDTKETFYKMDAAALRLKKSLGGHSK